MKLKDISKEIAILPPFKEHFSKKSFGVEFVFSKNWHFGGATRPRALLADAS